MSVDERISIRVSARTKMLVQEISEKMSVSTSLVIRALIERSLNEIDAAGLILPPSDNNQPI